MFKSNFDFLHRLVRGKKSETPHQQPGQDADERRVRVRYPARLLVSFQPVNGREGAQLTARVRNISRGGINLLVPRAFEPGELLGIELPGGEGRPNYTALACVVHATGEPDGEWSVGCTFSHELSNEDLEPFGARRKKPASPEDARHWVRFPCRVTAVCQDVAAAGPEPWPVQVLNISASGIGLLVSRSVEPGTLLSLELHRGQEQVGQTILACVVHVTPQGDGSLALGCNFIRELTDGELKALV